MLRTPSDIIRDLIASRQARSEIGAKQNFEKGLFRGLTTALAQIAATVLAQLKKHTFTVKVDNQIKLPEVQRVDDRATQLGLDAVERSVQEVKSEVSTLTKAQLKAISGLANALKPEKVDFAEVVKAVKGIKIPETKIPAPIDKVTVKNLDELKKPLDNLAAKLKIEFPTIDIPEFPETITVGNLEAVETLLASLLSQTEQLANKPEVVADYSPLIEALKDVKKAVDNKIIPVPQFHIPKTPEGLVPVSLQGSSFLDAYRIADTDDASNPKYYGFTDRDENWYLLKEDTTAKTYRYCKGTGSYGTAWTNRASQSYDYYHNVW